MKISTGKQNKAVKAVIYGPEGIGKSTLAGALPNPLFIDVEDGTSQLDVRRVNAKISTWDDFLNVIHEVVSEIKKDTGFCRTLVIDTIDAAELLEIEWLCKKYKTDNIETYNYGSGSNYLRNNMNELLKILTGLNKTYGINIVLLAHSFTRKWEKPDELGSFDRYELKLSKKNAPLIKEWCDALFFINYKTRVVSDKDNKNSKKLVGGERLIYSNHHATWDAKNRYGLGDELPLEFDSIKPAFILDTSDPVLHEQLSMIEPEKIDDEEPFNDDPEPVFEDEDFTEVDNNDIPIELKKLMDKDHVTEKEIIEACVKKNIKKFNGEPLSENSRISDLAPDWVERNLVKKWEVFKSKALGR